MQLGGVPRLAAGHGGDARPLPRPPHRRLLRPLAEDDLGAGTGGHDLVQCRVIDLQCSVDSLNLIETEGIL